MTYYSEDTYLSHYGVKGMKWGVHRSESHPKGVDRSKMADPINVRANKRAAVSAAASRFNSATERYSSDTARAKAAGDKAKAKALSSGASRWQARKASADAFYKISDKADARYDKAGVDYSNSIKKAKAQAKIDHKTNVQNQRSASLKKTFTTGKGIAEVLLVGPGAAYGYNTARAAGASRVGAAASAYTVNLFGGALYRKISGQ